MKNEEKIIKKLDSIEERTRGQTEKLLEHDEQFEKIAARLDSMVTRKEYLKGYDEMITILRRFDQERIFTTEWVKRIEREVQQHQQEITNMKKVLKIT